LPRSHTGAKQVTAKQVTAKQVTAKQVTPKQVTATDKTRGHQIEALNVLGNPIKKKYTGWTARVFQHEYDHLEGTVFVDRLDDAEDVETVKPILAQLAKTFKEQTGDVGAPELKF